MGKLFFDFLFDRFDFAFFLGFITQYILISFGVHGNQVICQIFGTGLIDRLPYTFPERFFFFRRLVFLDIQVVVHFFRAVVNIAVYAVFDLPFIERIVTMKHRKTSRHGF